MISYRRQVEEFHQFPQMLGCKKKKKCVSDLHRKFCKNIDSRALFPQICFSGSGMEPQPVFKKMPQDVLMVRGWTIQ